jgi:hypothetical protein
LAQEFIPRNEHESVHRKLIEVEEICRKLEGRVNTLSMASNTAMLRETDQVAVGRAVVPPNLIPRQPMYAAPPHPSTPHESEKGGGADRLSRVEELHNTLHQSHMQLWSFTERHMGTGPEDPVSDVPVSSRLSTLQQDVWDLEQKFTELRTTFDAAQLDRSSDVSEVNMMNVEMARLQSAISEMERKVLQPSHPIPTESAVFQALPAIDPESLMQSIEARLHTLPSLLRMDSRIQDMSHLVSRFASDAFVTSNDPRLGEVQSLKGTVEELSKGLARDREARSHDMTRIASKQAVEAITGQEIPRINVALAEIRDSLQNQVRHATWMERYVGEMSSKLTVLESCVSNSVTQNPVINDLIAAV